MRVALLTIGLLAVMVLVMPQAMARFSGQHTFINGSNVDCTKCHPDVESELSGNRPHVGTLICKDCHIGWNYPSGTPWKDLTSGGPLAEDQYYDNQNITTYHAAALVECLWCHAANKSNNPTSLEVDVLDEFNQSDTEAHRPLYFRAQNKTGVDTSDLLRGSNEACIACHTHAANVNVVGEYSNLSIVSNYTDCTGGANCYNGWNISMSVN